MRLFSRLRTTAVVVAIVAATAFGGPAKAVPTTALYLAMDGSGSISDADFTTQVSAYQAALAAVIPGKFGQVAIGGLVFGQNIFEFFPVTAMNGVSLAALDSALGALAFPPPPTRGGINTNSTAIGDAVTFAAGNLLDYEKALGSPLSLIIDVTTDGENNFGEDPVTASHNAVTSGINAVNCLFIGTGAGCGFVLVPPPSGTDFGQVSFADLEAALIAKIGTETVPEPASLVLLGGALVGFGVLRRRKRA